MELEFMAHSINNFIHITQTRKLPEPIAREVNEISKWEENK